MVTHSSVLAWRTPWTEEPGGLQSIGSQRVRHDRSKFAHTHSLSRFWVWFALMGGVSLDRSLNL